MPVLRSYFCRQSSTAVCIVSCPERKDKLTGSCQIKAHEFYSSSKEETIPTRIKQRITKACTEFCALDGRAFDLITGNEFQNLTKVLCDAGRSLYKSLFKINDHLPHSSTAGMICKDELIELFNIY
ncbi:unnamed protein product [Adineta ricciae]|uniref:Uncharacterized protein n=1 Tax=Adineta ricciae TaxID=249248 RepID=A0A815ULG7_ADIRI|nr:unnamed protein product [Adineta ricciae]